jgi:hypothetical protein
VEVDFAFLLGLLVRPPTGRSVLSALAPAPVFDLVLVSDLAPLVQFLSFGSLLVADPTASSPALLYGSVVPAISATPVVLAVLVELAGTIVRLVGVVALEQSELSVVVPLLTGAVVPVPPGLVAAMLLVILPMALVFVPPGLAPLVVLIHLLPYQQRRSQI